MTTLEIILIVAVVAVAAALLVTLAARSRDRRIVASREAAAADQRQRVTEATTRAERAEAEKHHALAELHETRLRVAALEQRRDLMEQEAGESPRRSIFRRSYSEVDPHDAEREQSGSPRAG